MKQDFIPAIQSHSEENESWSTESTNVDHDRKDADGRSQTRHGIGVTKAEEAERESCTGEINGKFQSQDSQEGDKTFETVPNSIDKFEIENGGENRARTERMVQLSEHVISVVGIEKEDQIQLGLVEHKNRKSLGVVNTIGDCPSSDPISEDSIQMGLTQKSVEETSPTIDGLKDKVGKVADCSGHVDDENGDFLKQDLESDEGFLVNGIQRRAKGYQKRRKRRKRRIRTSRSVIRMDNAA
ncbi:hypothetical protein SLA2020_463570 [Shorea laevis]